MVQRNILSVFGVVMDCHNGTEGMIGKRALINADKLFIVQKGVLRNVLQSEPGLLISACYVSSSISPGRQGSAGMQPESPEWDFASDSGRVS